MARLHRIRVAGLPRFVDVQRLLGPERFEVEEAQNGSLVASALLASAPAADVCARIRGLGLGGSALEVAVDPALDRSVVRAARTVEARRMRERSAGFSRSGTRCDDEGRWSLTPEDLAQRLGARARGRSVLDAGCGVGGNAIGFARAGCRVTAVDLSAERVEMARHNARVYGVLDRIRFVVGDARELIARSDAELLFVDPPWGRGYDKRRMGVAELDWFAEALRYRERFGALWAKVPPSFDVREVPEARVEAWFGVGKGDERRVKFLLLAWGGGGDSR